MTTTNQNLADRASAAADMLFYRYGGRSIQAIIEIAWLDGFMAAQSDTVKRVEAEIEDTWRRKKLLDDKLCSGTAARDAL